MKTLNIMRGYTGLQAFFPTTSDNVQEVTPVSKISISGSDASIVADRPRILTQRTARHARRFAH